MNNINILLHARIPKLLCKHKDDNKAKKKKSSRPENFPTSFWWWYQTWETSFSKDLREIYYLTFGYCHYLQVDLWIFKNPLKRPHIIFSLANKSFHPSTAPFSIKHIWKDQNALSLYMDKVPKWIDFSFQTPNSTLFPKLTNLSSHLLYFCQYLKINSSHYELTNLCSDLLHFWQYLKINSSHLNYWISYHIYWKSE